MKEPKVLVASPIYSGKHYMFPKWYENVQRLDYSNYDWIIVDNTSNMSYVSKLRRLGYKHIYHVPRGGSSRLGIARASEFIREYAIKHEYDYIMFIESDLLPPKNIIKRLLNHEKYVAGAVYEIGLHKSVVAPRRPLIYQVGRTEDNKEILEILPPEEGYSMMGKGLIKTPAMGLGCCLIHSHIFKKFPFKWNSKGKQHTDSLFYGDLWNAKEEVWVDTDILIPHYNRNWIHMKDW